MSIIKDEVYKFFAQYIYQNTGMVYAPNEYYRLDSRINDLVKFLNVKTVDEVYQMYRGAISPDMRAILINISTNNETYFFRDGKPFTILCKNVLTELVTLYPTGSLNIWSAASSTGQEAYSILMSIKNSLPEDVFQRIFISGSDISTQALKKATDGVYTGLEVQRGLPIQLLMKFFNQTGPELWKIDQSLTSKVKFYEFNLLTGHYPKDQYHIVFCRNVLIYQDNDNKKNILDKIYDSLKPGGYMFLGTGESLIGIQSKFERISFDGGAVYKKV